MKKKLLDYVIIFVICFFISPIILYIFLNSSFFNKYNLYFDTIVYIKMYYRLTFSGLFILSLIQLFNYLFKKLISRRPVVKANLISIEKICTMPTNFTIIKDTECIENYIVKFKHNDEIIDITISKKNIKSDLTSDEKPYVEYQYIDLINLFNKFLNIKVHTKK
ncbi:hypothetical protein OSC52_08035 [Clostridium pasteurianum]|uniref:hypothetical protein n=1 Tax=Clostridium pasteurianum TaxID=1501 RepID=UPI002260FA5B|nr:hypothetical protein [Clostridium pasteurianum]UZW15757.1 hypothetical protein OSC52_08035 [Clostridium pasteurianum]